MKKLSATLNRLKKEKRLGLMTHVIVGFPTLEDTEIIIRTMAENGADIIELQIPFSDPLADGPTIMRACDIALKNGTRVRHAFILAKKLSGDMTTPLLFMAYYNTVFSYGTENFCRDAAASGVQGLIVPDMPPEEERYEHFLASCRKYHLANIQVISPASTEERLQVNARLARGFVYCTARQGTTGATSELSPLLRAYLTRAKRAFSVPIAVGFGISTSAHLQALQGQADIAVIGSAIVDLLFACRPEEIAITVQTFLHKIRQKRHFTH